MAMGGGAGGQTMEVDFSLKNLWIYFLPLFVFYYDNMCFLVILIVHIDPLGLKILRFTLRRMLNLCLFREVLQVAQV